MNLFSAYQIKGGRGQQIGMCIGMCTVKGLVGKGRIQNLGVLYITLRQVQKLG